MKKRKENNKMLNKQLILGNFININLKKIHEIEYRIQIIM